jgi:Ca2+-transporting ATPase
VITLGLLFSYQYCIQENCTESVTRTTVFITLITSNVFLTLANRSFYYSILTTLGYKNNLVLIIIGTTILITSLLLLVPVFSAFFMFGTVSTTQIGISVLVGFVSVLWVEIYKGLKRSGQK